MWKEFFYYTRRERIAVVALVAAIGITFLGGEFVWRKKSATAISDSEQSGLVSRDSSFRAMCDSFLLTLRRERYPRYERDIPPEIPRSLFPFDPNSADSLQLIRLGLRPYVASNLLRYRRKGGVIRTAARFASIYGMDSASVKLLTPYLRIDTASFVRTRAGETSDTLPRPNRFPEKFKEVTAVELNSADTTLLRRIPGIGPGYATLILSYRRALGGYVSSDQLREIPGVSDSLFQHWKPWFVADRSLVLPIPVNEAGLTRLRNHPYLDFYQARVIYELRRERGRLRSLNDLQLLEEFTSADFIRLEPYLDFREPLRKKGEKASERNH